jgi:hypothetical protein
MEKRMRNRAIGLVLLLGFAGLCAAGSDVYSYKDASGQTHFTDRWRPGAVLVKRGSGATNPSPQQSPPANNAGAAGVSQQQRIQNDLQQAATARAVQADLRKKREEQCKKATEAYDNAIAARRIYEQDAKGNRKYLSDADADAARVKARQDRDTACAQR